MLYIMARRDKLPLLLRKVENNLFWKQFIIKVSRNKHKHNHRIAECYFLFFAGWVGWLARRMESSPRGLENNIYFHLNDSN